MLSFETLVFWFATLQCQITLSGGKSKSAGLKWQQCPQNERYCYIIFQVLLNISLLL